MQINCLSPLFFFPQQRKSFDMLMADIVAWLWWILSMTTNLTYLARLRLLHALVIGYGLSVIATLFQIYKTIWIMQLLWQHSLKGFSPWYIEILLGDKNIYVLEYLVKQCKHRPFLGRMFWMFLIFIWQENYGILDGWFLNTGPFFIHLPFCDIYSYFD